MSRLAVRRAGLLLVAASCSVLIVMLGLAADAERRFEREPAAVDTALKWWPWQSRALMLRSASRLPKEPDRAVLDAKAALRANPAEARALVLLARAENAETAESEVQLASQIGATNWVLRLEAADFWLQRRHLSNALREWSAALSRRHDLREHLFPVLTDLLRYDSARTELLAIRDRRSPLWWPDFVSHVLASAQSQEQTDQALMLATASQRDDLRPQLVERLMAAGQWERGYLTWLGGMTAEREQHLGLIFDGGFELLPDNNGFGWRFLQNSVARMGRGYRRGQTGRASAQLVFHGMRRSFHYLRQYVLLSPGRYEFSSRYQTEKLEAVLGLRWTLRCANREKTLLGRSARLDSSPAWRDLRWAVQVPPNVCEAQILTLETEGVGRPSEHAVTGSLWLDDLALKPLGRW